MSFEYKATLLSTHTVLNIKFITARTRCWQIACFPNHFGVFFNSRTAAQIIRIQILQLEVLSTSLKLQLVLIFHKTFFFFIHFCRQSFDEVFVFFFYSFFFYLSFEFIQINFDYVSCKLRISSVLPLFFFLLLSDKISQIQVSNRILGQWPLIAAKTTSLAFILFKLINSSRLNSI